MKPSFEKARELRKNLTPQERKMWQLFRNHGFLGYEIRRQYPIGRYIVDFICRSKKIIIEIDGGQHNREENLVYDKERTEYLNSIGYQVIRFWNNDIDNKFDNVYSELLKLFSEKS